MTERLVVIGGTGFVGRHLATELARRGIEACFLIHRGAPAWSPQGSVTLSRSSLEDLGAVRDQFAGASGVVNLLRPDGSGDRLKTLAKLMPALASPHLKRIVHASSIDVFGNAEGKVLTEHVAPRPVTAYAREHLAIEQAFNGVPRAVVVRLAAVFGAGGANVVSFAKEAATASRIRLSLRRALYGTRHMHLVSVRTVVQSIIQIATSSDLVYPPLLILSEDDDDRNCFAYMQDVLLKSYRRRPIHQKLTLPLAVVETLLRLRRLPYRDVRRPFLTAYPQYFVQTRADFGEELGAYCQQLAAAIE